MLSSLVTMLVSAVCTALLVSVVVTVLAARRFRRECALDPAEVAPTTDRYLGAPVSASDDVTEPVKGWKGAGMAVRPDDEGVSKVFFTALGRKRNYWAWSKAGCDRTSGHVGEGISECSCGFYALPSKDAARKHSQLVNTSVLLEVVASEEVVVHESGHRSSRQRIEHVHVRACSKCSSTPAVAFLCSDSSTGVKSLLFPRCASHLLSSSGTNHRVLTFDETSALLTAQVPKGFTVAVSSQAPALTREEVWAALPAGHQAMVLKDGLWLTRAESEAPDLRAPSTSY